MEINPERFTEVLSEKTAKSIAGLSDRLSASVILFYSQMPEDEKALIDELIHGMSICAIEAAVEAITECIMESAIHEHTLHSTDDFEEASDTFMDFAAILNAQDWDS